MYYKINFNIANYYNFVINFTIEAVTEKNIRKLDKNI